MHIGPSDYVQWLDDRKWAYIRMEGRSFGDVPLNIELKLEVVDSPNSAGIVIDAVRCAKLAIDNGIAGALEWPSAYFMKSPPVQHPDDRCRDEVEAFIAANRPPKRSKKEKAAATAEGVSDALAICLVCPYALNGAHPVAGHVRDVATALAGRGHRVTVLAPSASTQALRSGRRRLRALAGGDREALLALAGEPLAVAVGPSVPLVQRHRSRGVGIPVAANANVSQAVTSGGFDIVDAHEPHVPGISAAAVKHARGITVGTFHTAVDRTLVAPMRGSRRERYRARIDALIATSARAAERAATLYRGDYTIVPEVIDPAFAPGRKTGHAIVAAWSTESRPLARALIRLVARTPGLSLTLVWDRDGRRPLRPHVPAAARGRVSAIGPRDPKELAALLGAADVAVTPAGDSRFAWEARAAGAAVVSQDGLLGLAYAPDQPALAAAAAARLLDDDELRATLVAEGAGRRSPSAAPSAWPSGSRSSTAVALGRRRVARPRPAGRETVDVDLHMHTNHSHDCAIDPEALLDHAISLGLGAIAITDHNEICGRVRGAADRPREGQADRGDRRRGGEDLRGRGDRAVPVREDRAGHADRRDGRRDPAAGRPGADAPSVRPPAHDPQRRDAAPAARRDRHLRGLQLAADVRRASTTTRCGSRPSTTSSSRPAPTPTCCRGWAPRSTASRRSTGPRSSWSRCGTTRSSGAPRTCSTCRG